MKKTIIILILIIIGQRGWSRLEFKGLPYAYYGTDTGLGLGAMTYLKNNDTFSNMLWNLYLEVNFTTKKEQIHKLIFKLPLKGFNGLPLDITGRILYENVPYENYFGIGNDTSVIEGYTNYYRFHRITPYFSLIAETAFFITSGPSPYFLKGLININFELNSILPTTELPTNGVNFLFLDNPRGIEGGWIINPLIGIAWDGRDNNISTTRGTYHEASLEFSSAAWGSTYNYTRFTFINSGFLPIAPGLVLGERILWDVLWGDVPFFKTYRHGGLNPKRAIGGHYSVRGIPFYRYSDNIKLINNLELRWTPLSFPFLGSQWKLGMVAFWDSGRVWHEVSQMSLTDFHHSLGLGLRIHWGEDFVVAADFGFWEGSLSGVYIEVSEVF